jgi:hypothetical protein
MSKGLSSVGGGLETKGQSSGSYHAVSPGLAAPGGGRKKQTGGQSSKKSTQDALADIIKRDMLAGMPNVSKVPTLEE